MWSNKYDHVLLELRCLCLLLIYLVIRCNEVMMPFAFIGKLGCIILGPLNLKIFGSYFLREKLKNLPYSCKYSTGETLKVWMRVAIESGKGMKVKVLK